MGLLAPKLIPSALRPDDGMIVGRRGKKVAACLDSTGIFIGSCLFVRTLAVLSAGTLLNHVGLPLSLIMFQTYW